jgi:hypothetical protein
MNVHQNSAMIFPTSWGWLLTSVNRTGLLRRSSMAFFIPSRVDNYALVSRIRLYS